MGKSINYSPEIEFNSIKEGSTFIFNKKTVIDLDGNVYNRGDFFKVLNIEKFYIDVEIKGSRFSFHKSYFDHFISKNVQNLKEYRHNKILKLI